MATTSVVLDSSAMLAVLQDEPGAELVAPLIATAMISAVNFAEIIAKLIAGGGDPATVREDLGSIAINVVDFTRDLAEEAGALITQTKARGLSLGDRACLALARRENLPVMTADKAWASVNVGVQVELIR